ncbi:MAG: flagellar hook-length control protein FliK [Pseudomonadota bacterium]
MSIAINPVFPVVAAQGVAAGVALQPGTVIDATVLKQLDTNLVRIAIANLTIEVLSEVPLQPGQTLQLAVSQTPQGVRLQIVPGEGDAPSSAPAASAGAAKADTVSVPKADVPVQTAAAGRVLTNLEALAVSAAVQTAAARQGSLSPLFANLGVAASSPVLPQTLQQAAAQLLAQRTPLSENLTGDALKTAFRNSGLFLEQGLASSQASNGPDLKAALIVFRQTVASWLGNAPAESAASPQTANVPPTAAPPLAPEGGDILLPQTPARVADDAAELDGKVRIFAPNEPLPTAANRAAAASAGLTALQEVLQGFPKGVLDAVSNLLDAEARAGAAHTVTEGDEAVARTNVPPPPFRGSETTAQSIALPSLAPDDAPATVAHRLIEDTDAALARQTLLQAASLPVDIPGARNDPNVPRWNFEIPFATPQGTAVAQFEISRDGAGNEAAAASRVWRARFSLNVEPSGPVHALVSLSNGRTSVRMWAERSATAAQLRINAPQLSHALREAALEPGDIVIGEGAPPKAPPPPAGHFLDRAL